MVLSNKNKYIFIHAPKVAGQSVSVALLKGTYPWMPVPHYLQKIKSAIGYRTPFFPNMFTAHIRAEDLKAAIPEKFEEYYKFGFVRNPWDWQVSLYSYTVKNPRHYQHKLIAGMKDFDEYLEWRLNEDLFLQKQWFFDKEGNFLMDFVGKMENLNQDFAHICQNINIQAELPHINQSRKDNKIHKFYTQKTIDLVYEAFKEDVVAFNYTKPSC